jgi:3-oxoacyl-[acyl-carrier-protein] synthase-3
MTVLQAVATYIPPVGQSLSEVADELQLSVLDVKIYEKFYGLRDYRIDRQATGADLLIHAARALPTLGPAGHRVRYVLHGKSVPPSGSHADPPVQSVLTPLGLSGAMAFAVTQHACASGLLALDLAGRLLADDDDPDALALVLTGEKAYPGVNRVMPAPTVTGESSAACLVGRGGDGDVVLSYEWRVDGEFQDGIAMSEAARSRFHQRYPETLADVIRVAVAKAGLDIADITIVLPHNVNRASWVRVTKLLDLPLDRVYLDNVPITGHSFCADPFVNYKSVVDADLLPPGRPYLLASVGLGAVYAAMVLCARGPARRWQP